MSGWGRYKESEKKPGAADATRTGFFGPDCNTMSMSDGSVITRVGEATVSDGMVPFRSAAHNGDGCEAARLQHVDVGKATQSDVRHGWWQQTVTYAVPAPNTTDGEVALLVNVTMHVDPTNTTLRMSTTLTAVVDLSFCLGGISLLNLTVPHEQDWDTQPALFHGSTGGYADASSNNAFQPWTCALNDLSQSDHSCNTARRRYQYSDAPLIVSVDSGDDGRSSNENLPIWSVEVGSSKAAASAYGVWMGPEYSGLWALHGYKALGSLGSSFLISLPSMLFAMRKAEEIVLPRAAFGQW